ncbi:lantibiotic dehydratase [Dyadobacter crusticola]|uniref:lantibiotic dehydratase n=1 Tax=Dyadobacter crusticola TaxID=292407 RepID=UPI00068AC43C|nr:lantibiotic dehydratase [Dyadobacter crusticola]
MIDHLGFYMIRRPVKSVDHLFHIHQQLTARPLETLLKEYYERDLLAREAILVASPHFFERMMHWLRGEQVSEKKQLLATLYKYLLRSTTRCTPFGLFSCCATGEIGEDNMIGLSGTRLEKHISLDTEVLAALSARLINIPEIRAQLPFFVNTSLYDAGNKYHYVELLSNRSQSKYFISGLEKSEALSLVLDACKTGAYVKDLALMLMYKGNDPHEALHFVELLIENQIIVSDTNLTISGPGYLPYLISILEKMEDTGDLLLSLKAIQSSLQRSTDMQATNEKLTSDLRKLDIPLDKPATIKVDTFFQTGYDQLSDKLIDEIGSDIEKLMVLNQSKLPADLLNFRKRLIERYGGEEVSLAEALDEEVGIGYGAKCGSACSPMIEDLDLPASEPIPPQPEMWWQQFLAGKYYHAVQGGQNEIRLTNEDLLFIAKNRSVEPGTKRAGSFFLFGNLLAESNQSLDQGNYQFNLLACQGPSAVNMMSRFAQGIEGLDSKLRYCARTEQQMHPEVIFAEIIHHPDNKAGNIVNRPVLYKYEIPYLGQASVSEAFRIRVDDLLVSVINNEIVLRSKRLNKRIIPRLSNMHNHRTGLPVYRFLSDLQEQDANLNLIWDWGFLSKLPHLPRISYNKIIVSRESWLLQTNAFRERDLQALQQQLRRLKVPERFVVASGDNELLIDTSLPDSMQLLADICRQNETVKLMEFLGEPAQCVLSDGSDKFVSELVIPFIDRSVPPIRGISVPEHSDIPTSYILGDEWLYLKLYTHDKSNESPLISLLYQTVGNLIRTETIESFFFVRYQDPDPHLRLRFKGNPADKFHIKVIRVIRQALEPIIKSGVVYNIQTNIYQREITRYGRQNMELCEQFFHFDSLDTMRFLASRSCEEHERFLFAIKKTDLILTRSGLSMKQKHALLEKLKDGFFEEFKGDTALRKKLNVRFQQSKNEIHQTLLLAEFDICADQQQILAKLAATDNLQKESLLSSLVHMSINRIFASQQRTYELILYHCLLKYYDAQIAIRKPVTARNMEVERH